MRQGFNRMFDPKRLIAVLALAVTPAHAQVDPGPAATDPSSAHALLEALERADADLTDLTADINYVRFFEISGDRQVRRGTVKFRSRPAPSGEAGKPADRRFRVDFTVLEVGATRRDERRTMIFDGQWFVDAVHNDRLFVKRQVVPPGETTDPLRLGEGPFPLPLGQKKDEILARYGASIRPTDEALEYPELVRHVAGATQLRLVPKGADELDEVRLWYAQDGQGRYLPTLALTVNRAGDRSFVQMLNVRRNPDVSIPEAEMSTQTPESGWEVHETPWNDADRSSLDGR